MNNSGAAYRIAPETQQRVLQAAASLNYQPNAFARGLRNKQSFTVGVMVPEISEGYAATVLAGIEDALLQEHYFYFVVSHRHRPSLLQSYPRLLLSRAVEGLIAVDTPMREPLQVPVVCRLWRQPEKMECSPLRSTMKPPPAMQFPICLTWVIAVLPLSKGRPSARTRWRGGRASAKRALHWEFASIPIWCVQLEGNALGSEPGYVATKKLLQSGARFTAIFAFNDTAAIGAITALHEVGMRVPGKVSVVGFDDISSASTNDPALTTVRQPLYEMGKTAASVLLQRIRSGNAPVQPESVFRCTLPGQAAINRPRRNGRIT